MNIVEMIEKALANPDTPDYSVKILKSIKSQVSNGIAPTPKQYAVIFGNFRTKKEKAEIRSVMVAQRRARYK